MHKTLSTYIASSANVFLSFFFPFNEWKKIEEIKNNFNNVYSIRVNSKDNNLTSIQKKHITETALDHYNEYDYVIDNDGEDLEKKGANKKNVKTN